MNLKTEPAKLAILLAAFLLIFYLPVGHSRFDGALLEALHLAKWYAREHVILCLIPAFFIAGAIGVFVSQAAVMKYLGARAHKVVAYAVASVSGSVLAVCSCTILPLFAGIYRMGAGIGPASAFLYSGPAINVLAIILTARILGPELGIARALCAVIFSVVIGLSMHLIFRDQQNENAADDPSNGTQEEGRPLWQTALYFAAMVAILVFATWGKPQSDTGLWATIFSYKWQLSSAAALLLGGLLVAFFGISYWKVIAAALAVTVAALLCDDPRLPFLVGVVGLASLAHSDKNEGAQWLETSWGFAKQIMPLLLIGVLVAGALLGRPGNEGLLPSRWIAELVGGNSWGANFFAAVAGAFMYFATLTEIPILQGLLANGMGRGPALALLLAGPALSLPNMLVIRSVMGTKKTIVFVALVIAMATLSGIIFGTFYQE